VRCTLLSPVVLFAALPARQSPQQRVALARQGRAAAARALALELPGFGLEFAREVWIEVRYREHLLGALCAESSLCPW
jgi:hypothetical protein